MTDTFSRQERSQIMSRIRSKNSKAELVTFKYLRKKNIYFQKHYSRAPGKPDVALPRKKKAVFIDGDFWHGRHYERVVQVTKKQYWVDKIKYNMNRDKKNMVDLKAQGWTVLRVWESDILRKRTQERHLMMIANFLIDDK